MDLITILLIAVGLSFDTFAVSVSSGLTIRQIRFMQAVKIAFTLAFFQSLMPLIGWMVGSQFSGPVVNYDHWVAFGLLSALGLKMAYESFKKDNEKSNFNPLNLAVLLGMAVATSIDALVVGVSFALIEVNIYWTVLVIGVVTFLVSMAGMLFGKKVGGKLGKRMEIIGGLILIGIGIKILLEHLQ
jgi:putative Mn2+ efflux pump MntP